ncbi:hypothetical protein HMPREF9441_02559 [Paraprevotella clara YIT 11840]|uniref:Uncharacterized protein n=1 Tax=Paraprevotella clara YIT 11840 TaxID=762968 RepID=G5ST59_9BACT|nr:hypothetical protein HMPREF9441_02559 [Paraprevotella clara YIT 11840]
MLVRNAVSCFGLTEYVRRKPLGKKEACRVVAAGFEIRRLR